MKMAAKFQGKVVLITGASSEIGGSIARRFAELGASLALTGRKSHYLKEVASKCKKLNNISNSPFIITADLSKESDLKNLVELVLKHFKRLDILINNAGLLEPGSIENTSIDQFDRLFNVNVRAIYQLTMLTVPHIVATKGCIVNVSSLSSSRAYNHLLPYSMSKAALDQFTKCVALELAPKGVRVNSVNPGIILHETLIENAVEFLLSQPVSALDKGNETSTNGNSLRDGHSSENLFNLQAIAEKFFGKWDIMHPMGHPGSPEDIAKCICFLASDDACFTTGVLFPVDGGKHVCGAT